MSLLAGMLFLSWIIDTLTFITITHLWPGLDSRIFVPVDQGLSYIHLYMQVLAESLTHHR